MECFFLVTAVVTPAARADSVTTTLSDYVYTSQGMSWSGMDNKVIYTYLDTSAGGTVVHVPVTINWDGLAVANLVVLAHSRDIKTNTGDTQHFIEAMGSAFFGKRSYHTFSDPADNGYEEFWVVPDRMVFYGGHGSVQVSKKYTLSVYAQSEEEAKAEIKAGFDALGLEASVSVTSSVKVGEKVEYTAEVTVTVYQHYWDTEYVGSLHYHQHINHWGPGPAPTMIKGASTLSSSDIYDYKDFAFEKSGYIYSYEDVDLDSQGITGEMVD